MTEIVRECDHSDEQFSSSFDNHNQFDISEHISSSYISSHVREQYKIARPLLPSLNRVITIISHVNCIFLFSSLKSNLYVKTQHEK